MRGGAHGITTCTTRRPAFTELLNRIVRDKCPSFEFTSVAVCYNIQAPVHTDKYNIGQNALLPLKLPRAGGNLWLELRQGDTVQGDIALHPQQRAGAVHDIVGQLVSLKAGCPVFFNPKHKHATEPWKEGDRLVLAAYVAGSHHKARASDLQQLEALNFSLPPSAAASGTQCTMTAHSPSEPPLTASEPKPPAPARAGAPARPQHQESKRVRFAATSRSAIAQVLRRVLLITLCHSTVAAFMNAGWEPVRLRPLELLRSGYHDVLHRLKEGQFDAVWIDLQEARQFAGQERTHQVCNRLSVIMSWARRQSVPVCLSALRRTAWTHPAIQQLVQTNSMHVTHHRWCAAGAKILQSAPASSVQHRVLSTFPLQAHPCRCSPGTEHVFDLDMAKECGGARVRAKAEEQAISCIIPALEASLPGGRSLGSEEQSDPFSTDVYVACKVCGLVQQGSHCNVCESSLREEQGGQESPDKPAATFVQPILASAAPPGSSEAYPTSQKLLQRERVKQQKASGQPEPAKAKRRKAVEQHFDDCGEDISSICMHAVASLLHSEADSTTSDAERTAVNQSLPPLNATALWSNLGSTELPDTRVGAVLAVDLDELMTILATPAYATWGIEVMELCGGEGLTSQMCVRRSLKAGHNFEITTGTDLTVPAVQRTVLDYVRLTKPLVVVMAPRCDPFGPLGSRNRVIHQAAWQRAYAQAAPLARFCGEIAQVQQSNGRYYVVEQPYPSSMYEVSPWPDIRTHSQCQRVVFHQCMVGQAVQGVPAKKPTELVANCPEVLQPFCNLQCDGQHEHASLLGSQAKGTQRWTPKMCRLLAYGIEQLVRRLSTASGAQASYPSVASGTTDAGEKLVPEAWRKCKGCLWRLNRWDEMHSRIRGECKYPDDETIKFECPGCKNRKPRHDESHTFGPDCKHAVTIPRKSAKQRRPFGRVPARGEPTSGIPASKLGIHDEQKAEEATASEPSSSHRGPQPIHEDDDAASSLELPAMRPGDEPDQDDKQGEPRRRGPDVVPRERRTWRDAAVQPPAPADWGAFDVQATLRGLRHGDEAARRRLLRKLHLRWFHCSTDKMKQLLRTAGLSNEVLDLVDSICDTCKVCRHWARPSSDVRASSRMVIGFNIEVEGDLMFFRHKGSQCILLVLTDRGVRWTAVAPIPNRSTSTILSALDKVWMAVFGPMQILIFDGEHALDDEESTMYFQMKGVTKRTAAPHQHTRIVDRKIAVLRDSLHKMVTQLDEEGLQLPLERIVCDCVYALNALTSINGRSPYEAVLGRTPALLPSDDMLLSDGVPDIFSRHTHRLREIAVQAIAEGTARERIKRATHTQTKPAGLEFQFELGQSVDYWREPQHKEASGWRGPAVIADLTRLEHGRVGVRTSTDQVLTCRLQDVRPSLAFLSEELAAYFGADDHVAPAGSQANHAQQVVQQFVDDLKPNTVVMLKGCGWRRRKLPNIARYIRPVCISQKPFFR